MIEVCLYCGTPRDDRLGCCGENHWEEVEDQEVMIPKHNPPMTQTEEYLLLKQGLDDFKNYWNDLD